MYVGTKRNMPPNAQKVEFISDGNGAATDITLSGKEIQFPIYYKVGKL